MTMPFDSFLQRLPQSVRSYFEPAPLAALCLGISSGFPFAMIGATLTTRLAQDGISKRSVTAFSLAFLVYNLKFLWAPAVDRMRLPGLAAAGQRRSWLWFSAAMVMLSVCHLGFLDPQADLARVAVAAVTVGLAGATFDIVIDAYRIELLEPRQLGVGSGMSQYGWRIGSASAGALALVVAQQAGWGVAYAVCSVFALPAMVAAWWMGEPPRHRELAPVRSAHALVMAVLRPLGEFLMRPGALIVLMFVLLHKIGDTLANLTLRLLLNDLGFSNDEVARYDVGFGFVAYLAGIFAGGLLYSHYGMRRAVLISLVLMAVSNLSFAGLAVAGHSNAALAAAIGFENLASGIGGVVVVAYLSALCNLAYTGTQFALLSACASIAGRLLSGTSAGAMIEAMGYVAFYLFTTLIAVPGVLLYLWMMRSGAVSSAIPEADIRRDADAS